MEGQVKGQGLCELVRECVGVASAWCVVAGGVSELLNSAQKN